MEMSNDYPDSAYGQDLCFDGCLFVFNLDKDVPLSYKAHLEKAIGDAYAQNALVFFVYDNDVGITLPPKWIDLLEYSYAVSLISSPCGINKAEFPLLPEQREDIFKSMCRKVKQFNQVKIKGDIFWMIGKITISGNSVLMPLTRIDL